MQARGWRSCWGGRIWGGQPRPKHVVGWGERCGASKPEGWNLGASSPAQKSSVSSGETGQAQGSGWGPREIGRGCLGGVGERRQAGHTAENNRGSCQRGSLSSEVSFHRVGLRPGAPVRRGLGAGPNSSLGWLRLRPWKVTHVEMF